MKKYIKPIIKVFKSAMGLMSASGGGHNSGLTPGSLGGNGDNNGVIKGNPIHGGEDEL